MYGLHKSLVVALCIPLVYGFFLFLVLRKLKVDMLKNTSEGVSSCTLNYLRSCFPLSIYLFRGYAVFTSVFCSCSIIVTRVGTSMRTSRDFTFSSCITRPSLDLYCDEIRLIMYFLLASLHFPFSPRIIKQI